MPAKVNIGVLEDDLEKLALSKDEEAKIGLKTYVPSLDTKHILP